MSVAVYTKNSRYFLNKADMTVIMADNIYELIEWPVLKIGEPLNLIIRQDKGLRDITTSIVIGIV